MITPSPTAPPPGHVLPPSAPWRLLARPIKPPALPTGLDALVDGVVARVQAYWPRTPKLLQRAEGILQLHRQVSDLAESRLREQLADLHAIFRRGREVDAQVDQALAILCEVSVRRLGLLPHREQLAAALAMRQGCLAELATGEGKTLVAALCATLWGWRGLGAHVITVNDYLVRRDAEGMKPIYHFAGLKVGYVQQKMDPAERRHAYASDITYATNKEVTADFLRDRLVLGRLQGLAPVLLARLADGQGSRMDHLVMRSLEYAIVDEADSLLIDEAVTPLIISGDAPNAEQVESFRQAAELASQLQPGRDYLVSERFRDVDLTRQGRQTLADLAAPLGGLWHGVRRREELVVQALTAREIFLRDKQYIVQEDKVVIVDEFTGRLMPDRTWRDGLHQAIEAKETLTVNPPKATLARVSFQRFFRLYKHLSGMTGTAWETRHEVWQVYRMPVVRIPTHKPCIRVQLPDRVFIEVADKWQQVVAEIKTRHEKNQPCLVGTRSIQASEHLSTLLTAAGLEHQVLNAVRQEQEAAIVAAAGQPGRITVATNMAGRGTDIMLGQGVAEVGGLHVIATERHEAGRIDRQLFGRAGRQGDPGSAVAFVSLDDELIRRYLPGFMVKVLELTLLKPTRYSRSIARVILHLAQARAQHIAHRQRQGVLRTDDWLDDMLGFAGRQS
ncbi:MAG: preprotein translocase subunit SecA [Phycisphaeraceae bacterium]|nr:preprotein translocase subunit SecA [Phycisphaeraceae bacterium]